MTEQHRPANPDPHPASSRCGSRPARNTPTPTRLSPAGHDHPRSDWEILGRVRARAHSGTTGEVITNRAAGYVWEDGRLQNGRFIAPTFLGYAGGGLRSTVLDLAKWDAALYSEKVLKPSSLKQMWTPTGLNDGSKSTYGFGRGITNYHGHRLIRHTGSHATGFKTVLARFVDDKLTVIIFTNQRGANQTAIANGVEAF